jgi:hypothetical protein
MQNEERRSKRHFFVLSSAFRSSRLDPLLVAEDVFDPHFEPVQVPFALIANDGPHDRVDPCSVCMRDLADFVDQHRAEGLEVLGASARD